MSSSLVSSENGAPFVSRAQASKPSGDKYAFGGGFKRTKRLWSSVSGTGGAGTQYFPKMCFKHTSNYIRVNQIVKEGKGGGGT